MYFYSCFNYNTINCIYTIQFFLPSPLLITLHVRCHVSAVTSGVERTSEWQIANDRELSTFVQKYPTIGGLPFVTNFFTLAFATVMLQTLFTDYLNDK